MSRLLFAAARGARVQMTDFDGGWYAVNIVMNTSEDRYRIYPEDEHLQYGPISTALREKAKDTTPTDSFGLNTLPYMDVSPYFDSDEFWDWVVQPELHRSIFLLILAEALADEGL